MAGIKLLPCPFCGSDAWTLRNGSWWCVACRTPFCCDVGKFDTEAEAIEAWNTRAETVILTGITTVTDAPQITYVPERTCENVGYYIDSTRFKCSNCGYNGWTKWAKDGEDRVPNYCPNCGRKVSE